MCGRFTLRTSAKDIADLFDTPDVSELRPRYNIAPTQQIAAVRQNPVQERRELVLLHWGLIPFWAKERNIGRRMINARAETVAAKPAFRRAFKTKRCLVVADGFYEWKKTNGKKQPFYIRMQDDLPFAFAGLWEHWKGDGDEIQSGTIIVTEANGLLAPIHNRMPVIIAPHDYDLWLDPKFQDATKLEKLLQPFPAEAMEAFPVSTIVNNPQNDLPTCIRRSVS